MIFPNVRCELKITTTINPSEDFTKIETAILNIFPNIKIETNKFLVNAYSKNIHALEKIYDYIQNKQLQKIYQRQLEKNLENNSTWFYINKQAAFVGGIVLCEESEESPLGPIKVIITSSNIDAVIDWLIIRD
jgi:hypothetical protein